MPTIKGATVVASNISKSKVDTRMGNVVGAFFLPKGTVITNTQLATDKASLQTLMVNANINFRTLIVGRLGQFKDNTKAPNVSNLDGIEKTTQELPQTWYYQMIDADYSYYQQVRNAIKFAEGQYDIIPFDSVNNIVAVDVVDETTGLVTGISGLSINEINVLDWTQQTTTTLPVYGITLSLADRAEYASASLYKLSFNPLSMTSGLINKGVQTVQLTDITPAGGPAAGTFEIEADVAYGALNLAKTTAASLFAVVTAWTVKKNHSGTITTVTPSSIAINSAGTGYLITCATPTSGDTYTFTLKDVTTLAALTAPAKYYEAANTVSILIP